MFGIKEELILKNCKEYIMIGSQKIHKYKPIMRFRHETHRASSFVISRSQRGDDKIWCGKGWKK